MLIRIHDLPVTKYRKGSMTPVSFHATEDPIERIWWDARDGRMDLEVVTSRGEVWALDFKRDRWCHIETIHMEEPPSEKAAEAFQGVKDAWRDLARAARKVAADWRRRQ